MEQKYQYGTVKNVNMDISNIIDKIPDNDDILITYIDSIQQDSIKNIMRAFTGADGGLTIHNLKHPHWRNNKYYCFVRHDENNICKEVIEKYNFNNLDMNNSPGRAGSSGCYYFSSGKLMKEYFIKLMTEKRTVNSEYYVTQPFQEMIVDGLSVKAHYCPYVSFGIPEDVEDYVFWDNWFR